MRVVFNMTERRSGGSSFPRRASSRPASGHPASSARPWRRRWRSGSGPAAGDRSRSLAGRAAGPEQGVGAVALGNDLLGDHGQAGLLDPRPIGRGVGVAPPHRRVATQPACRSPSCRCRVTTSHPPGRSHWPIRPAAPARVEGHVDEGVEADSASNAAVGIRLGGVGVYKRAAERTLRARSLDGAQGRRRLPLTPPQPGHEPRHTTAASQIEDGAARRYPLPKRPSPRRTRLVPRHPPCSVRTGRVATADDLMAPGPGYPVGV